MSPEDFPDRPPNAIKTERPVLKFPYPRSPNVRIVRNAPQPKPRIVDDEVEALLGQATDSYVERWIRPSRTIGSQIIYDEDQLDELRWLQAKAKVDVAGFLLSK